MSQPLIISFSEALLNAPVQERVNSILSVVAHLRRENVQALSSEGLHGVEPLTPKLEPLFSSDFYHEADAKKVKLERGAENIPLSQHGFLEASYIFCAAAFAANLTPDQKAFVEDVGFTTRPYAPAEGFAHLCVV